MADIDNLKGGTKQVVEESSLDNLRGGTKRVIQVNSLDNLRGGTKRVYVVGGGGGSSAVIDPLNVTPTTSAQTITASGGVDGYSPVNVSAVDASIDANITAGNIKKDVSILGITGTYEGQTPTGSISITSNGTYDVTDKAEAVVNVPTTAPALYREFQLDNTGKLVPNTTTTHIMNFTGVTNVSAYAFAFAYQNNTAISGTVDMSDLTTLSENTSCQSMFSGCTGLTSADLSSLTTLSGSNACSTMFGGCTGLTSINLPALTTASGNYTCNGMFGGCTGLTSINLPALTTISGSNACNSMFGGCTSLASADLSSLITISGGYACGSMFYGCNGLISMTFPSLTTISGGNACSTMFQGCTGLTSVDLSALTVLSGNSACSSMFYGCTSLATVYIGGTTAIDFGGRTNQFNYMFNNCTQNIDVYAPAANQAQIEAFSGYPNFSGTGTVTWHWRS